MKHNRENDVESEDDRGTIEAGLVIIPTTLLFLMILQIIFAGSLQIVERAKLHNLVIESSLAEVSEVHNGMGQASLSEREVAARINEKFSPNTQISIEGKATSEGQLQRIELITPIPILNGVFNFLGITDIGVRNVAVLIEN